MAFCGNCGTELTMGDKFCRSCGVPAKAMPNKNPIKSENVETEIPSKTSFKAESKGLRWYEKLLRAVWFPLCFLTLIFIFVPVMISGLDYDRSPSYLFEAIKDHGLIFLGFYFLGQTFLILALCKTCSAVSKRQLFLFGLIGLILYGTLMLPFSSLGLSGYLFFTLTGVLLILSVSLIPNIGRGRLKNPMISARLLILYILILSALIMCLTWSGIYLQNVTYWEGIKAIESGTSK